MVDKLLNATQLKAIQDNMRQNHTKAFATLNSSLYNYKSFLGRDYKIMVQNMPTVLKTSFEHESFNSCTQHVKDAIFNCFDSISCLTSLVYMGEIRYNYEGYLIELKQAVSVLVVSMNRLDHINDVPVAASEARQSTRTRVSDLMDSSLNAEQGTEQTATLSNGVNVPHPETTGTICNRLKTHLLAHIDESVKRFGSLLWCETEKNEQFNSSIRGVLIKSSRRGSSKHLCKFFGRIEYLQLIAMGGSWDYGERTGGASAQEFAQSEDSVGLYLSADRLFQENNHADVQKIVVGVSAIFEVPRNDGGILGTKLILGKVVEKKKEMLLFEEYQFVLENEDTFVAETTPVFSSCKKDIVGNFLASKTGSLISGTVFEVCINEVMDMSQTVKIGDLEYAVVNKSKNGTLWWVKNVCPLTFKTINQTSS